MQSPPYRLAQLTGIGVSVVVVNLLLGGVQRPDRVRIVNALALERALVQLQADQSEYRQNEHG